MAVKLIEIDSELGAGTRGASLGIGALKVAAFNNGVDVFSEHEALVVETCNDQLWDEVSTPFAKRISGINTIFERTNKAVSDTLRSGHFPIVVSGDHSTAGGTIAGIKSAFPDKKLGVVWIDAHADLHTPFTTPSGNVHGMPLATALQIDNKNCQRNEPDEETVQLWEQLKQSGGSDSKLTSENLVFVAVRDTEKEEDSLMSELNITNHLVADVRSEGCAAIVAKTLEQLSDCDHIYVSFDVDSMDCDEVSHGTGTPVKNGLMPEEAKEIILSLIDSKKLVCFEMVEINPCLDEKINKMAETAIDILKVSTDQINQVY